MARMKRSCSLLPWHSSGSGSSDVKPSHSVVVKDRKPVSLTSWFSVFCLVYALALIAALEYCFGTFPSADSRRTIPDGRGYEIYGPFNSAPLGRMAAVTTASTAIPTASFLQSWNTSTSSSPVTSEAVLTTISAATSSSSIASSTTPEETPYTWDDAYNQAVMFGVTPGIPGYGLNITIPDIALTPNLTTPSTNSSILRRVPPRDKWGQISGRVQYVVFDVLGWKYRDQDPWTVASYVWYFYLSSLTGHPSDQVWLDIKYDKSACPIVCDGPALVFLEPYCWDSWKDKARLYSIRLSQHPGATTTQSEDVWRDATVCASITREHTPGPGADIVASTFRSKWTGNVGIPVTIRTTVDGTPTKVVVVTPAPTALPVVGTARPSIGGGGGDGGANGGHEDGGHGGTRSVTEVWITTTLIRQDSLGRPVSTITAVLRATHTTMTLYDSSGRPTATITTDLLLAPGIRTVDELRDGRYDPGLTTTITTGMVPLTPGGMMVVTDSRGIPVATLRGYRSHDGRPAVTVKPDSDSSDRTGAFGGSDGDWSGVGSGETGGGAEAVHPLSWGDYVVASFAPVLMALPLAILIQIQSSTIKQLLPVHVLSRSDGQGVSAGKSLCLTTGGIQGLVNSIQLLIKERDPLLFLADLHVLASSLVVSFSSEAMGVKLYGQCTPQDFTGCRLGIAVFRVPGRMVEGFLVLAVVTNLVINVLLRRSAWKTAAEIHSRHGGRVSTATSLLTNSPLEARKYFEKIASGTPHGAVSNKELKKHFAGCLFSIRSSSSLPSTTMQPEKQHPQLSGGIPNTNFYYLAVTPSPPNLASMFEEENDVSGRRWQERLVGIFTTRYQDTINQVGFLLAVIGFLIMLFYYELTNTTSAFEHFMNSQGLGVRAVFTGLGVIVSLFWDNYFSNVATQRPYRQLHGSNTPFLSSSPSIGSRNRRWCRMFPPTVLSVISKPFIPVAKAIERYTFLGLVTLTTALSKITPLLLANVPFSPWLTWTTHEICTWAAISILLLMVVVLLCGMAIDGLRRRRERRGREQGHAQEFVEVDLSTLGGKLVFGALYCTDRGKPPPLSTASSWETLRVSVNKV